MEVTGTSSPQQPRLLFRKRKIVLYDQEMINGEKSMEGVVDEDLSLSKRTKSSGRLKIKSRKLMRNLRPRTEFVGPGSTDSDPEYMRGGNDEARMFVEIDEATPRRSARCCKLSWKIIQIKKERQETDLHEDAAKLVKNRKKYHLVEINNITREIYERAEEIPAGLRRSSRICKPTKEIMNFRKEHKDDNTDVESRRSYLHKSKKKLYRAKTSRAPEKASSINSKQRVKCSYSNADDVSHPTSPGLTRMPPPVSRQVVKPPAEEVADVTTITPRQARKLCTLRMNIPSVSEHFQVRPLVELLAVTSCENAETSGSPLPKDATEDSTSPKKKKLVVLTESEGRKHNEDDKLPPSTLKEPMQDMRDWNCFQCVYELSKLDDRLTISDLDPLLEKMVDGDALMKSSLSDLVNVVGLQYSPAVRVVFLVQQMVEETSGEG